MLQVQSILQDSLKSSANQCNVRFLNCFTPSLSNWMPRRKICIALLNGSTLQVFRVVFAFYGRLTMMRADVFVGKRAGTRAGTRATFYNFHRPARSAAVF